MRAALQQLGYGRLLYREGVATCRIVRPLRCYLTNALLSDTDKAAVAECSSAAGRTAEYVVVDLNMTMR